MYRRPFLTTAGAPAPSSRSLPLSLVTADPPDAAQHKTKTRVARTQWPEKGNTLALAVRKLTPVLPLQSLLALSPTAAAAPSESAGITLAVQVHLTDEEGTGLAGVPVCFWYEDRHGWRLPMESPPLELALFTHGMDTSDEHGRLRFTMPYPTAVTSGDAPVIFVRAYLPSGPMAHSHADGVLQLPNGQNPFYALMAGTDAPAHRVPRRRFGAPVRLLQGLSLDVATAQVQVTVGLKVRVAGEKTTRKPSGSAA